MAAGVVFALAQGGHPVLLAAALAHAGHLLADFVANKPRGPLTYSLLYRAAVRFERVRLVDWTPTSLTEALHHSIPLWRHVEPRLPSLLARFLDLDR